MSFTRGGLVSAKRSILWAAAGAVGAAAALVAAPGTYEWLERVTGRSDDRRHYETEPAEPLAVEPEPAVTEDLRLSLRARLAESAAEEIATVGEANAEAAGGVRADPVEVARARVRSKAASARERITRGTATDTAGAAD
jgi:hypothetical protein